MSPEREEVLAALERRLGYRFQDRGLLDQALTHPSLELGSPGSYERLEFLGDAVLGHITAAYLYREYPEFDEGQLTRLKSALVSGRALARLGLRLDLPGHLAVGKGILGQRAVPTSAIANAMEAVIGALYLDGGLSAAQQLVHPHLEERKDRVLKRRSARNHKSDLQHHTQQQGRGVPSYQVLDVSGPDHERQFTVCAVLEGRRFPSATGSNKKIAEQRAARIALAQLRAEQEEEQEGHGATPSA